MSKILASIRPNGSAVMVDCPSCQGRQFQIHVRPENNADARIVEIACVKCGHASPVEYGFLGGKLNNHGPAGIDIPVPPHSFK